MIYQFKLDNGIRCLINKIDGVFSVSAGIIVGAGSALETEAENGISHFIEHVNFKGTEKRSAFQISSDVDNLGGQINAFTSKEFTCYYIKAISEHFSEVFEILSDLFINSVYDNAELKKESGVIIEEINMYEDTPDEVCADGLSSAYFGNNGFGRTILGSTKNVSSFNRDSVLAYKKKYYTTDNIIVSIAGAVDVEQAKELCQKYFGEIAPSKKQTPPTINLQNLNGNFSAVKNIEQVHIALAVPAVSALDKLNDAYSVICGALGGGMSSRLFQVVREQMGLAYSVYSYVASSATCGNMTVYAGVGAKNYLDAYNAVLEVMNKFKTEGVTEEEFLRSREQMKSSFIMSQENTSSQMILFGKYLLLTDKLFSFETKLEDINKLTLEGVNYVIKNVLDFDSMSTSIVGKKIKKLR